MKKTIVCLSVFMIINIANAEYSIKINLEDEPIKFTNWQEYDSIYGDWTNSNSLYGCSNWTPLPNEVTINLEYTQTATNCSQDQNRTVQDQTIDTVSGQIVNDGNPYTESRTIPASDIRQAIGTMETWFATIPDYTDWSNTGSIYGCNTWTPATSTVTINQTFIQTSNDCEQNQERTRQDREQETTTNEIRNSGTPVIETRAIAATSTRNATGTKETWVSAAPTYTTWVNSGGIYGCSNWSPAASTVASGQNFTQTATDCEQNQTRNRQDRQQETTTLAYRNVDSPVTETNVLYNRTNTRTATGTKALAPVCSYSANKTQWLESENWSTNQYTLTVLLNGQRIFNKTYAFSSGPTNGKITYNNVTYFSGSEMKWGCDDNGCDYIFQVCH